VGHRTPNARPPEKLRRGLVGVISEIVELAVRYRCLHLRRSFDTGLVTKFDGRRLDKYNDKTEHRVADLGRQIAERVVSVVAA